MENCESLAWYGAFVLALAGGFAFVPYWYRKAELISGWNCLLAGILIFLGLGCFEAATAPMRFRGLDWFEPTRAEVKWFLTASSIFLVALFAAYYYDPVSRKLGARWSKKWPPLDTRTMLFVIVVCALLAFASRIPALQRITFIGPVLKNVSHKAFVFSVLFSFVLWYRQKGNIVWLTSFIVVFLAACVLAMVASGGRRLLLSVLIGPVVVIYYYNARLWRPSKSMVIIAIAVFVIFNLNLMYSTMRHFDRRGERAQRSAANIIKGVEQAARVNWYDRMASSTLFHFSQQVVHYSLITDRFISMHLLEPKYLNTFKFLASYPVPRQIWPEKPRPLGGQIGVEAVPHFTPNLGIRWGCGVSGQAIYEGGLWPAVVFAYLGVLLTRLIDEPLRRDPHNPFLLAVLAAASSHLLGWPRGDIGVMSIEVIECFVFAFVLGFACRMLFGTERTGTRIGAYAVPAARPYSYPYRA